MVWRHLRLPRSAWCCSYRAASALRRSIGFFAHYLYFSSDDHVLTVTQSLGLFQRRREVEAYALQSQASLVESLLVRYC